MPCNTNTTPHVPRHHSQQHHHVTPQALTTITAHPPQLQRGEGTQKTHRRSPPGQKGGRKVAGEKTLHPRGRGATMTCMHVAHAVVGPIEKAVLGWGAESGVQIGEGVGAVGRERGRRSRTPPVVEERDGGGLCACMHRLACRRSISAVPFLSPWEVSVVFPTKA